MSNNHSKTVAEYIIMLRFFGNLRFILLFAQIIFFANFINAFPNELTTIIVDENGVEIVLKWVKTNQFLANEHLPIWRAQTLAHLTKDKKVMKNLGNFQMYHDIDKSSAVIYLQKDDSLYGVIDTRYLLFGFPVGELREKHNVGQADYLIRVNEEMRVPNIRKSTIDFTTVSPINYAKPSISKVNPKKLPLKKRPFVYDEQGSTSRQDSSLLNEKRPRFNEEESSIENNLDEPSTSCVNSNSQVDRFIDEDSEKKTLGPFYPEILLFVSHDVMKTRDPKISTLNYLKNHVMYYLIYMNAVSMLFAKLSKDVEININIAGIIFEEAPGAFPFSTSEYVNGQLICPNQQLVSDSLSRYINYITTETGEEIFFEDSIDFFLFSTKFNYATNEDERIRRGISTEWFDIHNWRITNKIDSHAKLSDILNNYKSSPKYLGSIIDNTEISQAYINAAREIAHLMKINDDNVKSQNIMRKNSAHHCVDCLKWSYESIEGFKNYFSQNKNRCFLLNEPRSLHDYGIPRETLSPKDQCGCYGLIAVPQMDKYLNYKRHTRTCQKRLPCLIFPHKSANSEGRSRRPQQVPLPVDGTPCALDRVCWQKRCVAAVMKTK